MRITTTNPSSFQNWKIAKQSIASRNQFSESLSNAISASSSDKTSSFINEENRVEDAIFDKVINETEYHLPTGINMNSKGDKILSSEQIGKLKEKYDVENMTESEMMDLLGDLCDLGVVSGEEFHSVITMPKPPETSVLGRRHTKIDFDFSKSGDILGMLAGNMAEIDAAIGWYKSQGSKFDFDIMDEKRYIFQLNEKKQHFQSISDVLSQLR
ncbi:MAG: hypothetical protein RR048_01805 [Oscillospiraceae bacterium]